MSVEIKLPRQWGSLPKKEQVRYLVARQRALILAHNADCRGKPHALIRQRQFWNPRLSLVGGLIADAMDSLPLVKEGGDPHLYYRQGIGRGGRHEIADHLTAAEREGVDLDAEFSGGVPLIELPDPLVDWTAYSETDPGGRWTIAANTLTATAMPRNETAYTSYDYGTGHFGTSFEHLWECKPVSQSGGSLGIFGQWGVSNTVADEGYLYNNSLHALMCDCYNNSTVPRFTLWACATQAFDDTPNLSYNTDYYLRGNRATTNWSVYVYTDSARTSLADTMTCTISGTQTYRYGLVGFGWNSSQTPVISGEVRNLDLQEAAADIETGLIGGKLIRGGILRRGLIR